MMHFYTSINNNYLPKARVLAKSIKQYCPNSKFTLVLSDQLLPEIELSKEPFDEILTVDQLGIPVENLNLWIYTHTVVELCTAVKGQALVKFLEQGSEKVVYIDPDIAVFDSLSEIQNLLDIHDVLLTPHQTLPETTKLEIMDNEICSLMHGTYNFGFYAVKNSENGLKFAKWWRDRLIDFCFDDIPNGLFTDQKWGDLVPALFDGVFILKDPGCNVSTWNLTNRTLSKDENEIYYVNGQRLKFYHFSSFDSGNQKIMLDRYAKGNPLLYELRDWYGQRQKEEEQEKYGTLPSIYNFYDNGEKIEKEQRTLLRKRLDVSNFFAQTDPHIVEQDKSYYKWYQDKSNFPLSEIDQLHMEYKKTISKINFEKEVLDTTIVKINSEKQILDTTLNDIYSSKAWKFICTFRKIKSGKFK